MSATSSRRPMRPGRLKALLVAIAGVLGALGAAATLLQTGWMAHDRYLPRASPAVTSTATAPAAPVLPAVTGTSAKEGSAPTATCFAQSASVDCAAAHDAEVVSDTSSCSLPAVVTYLGGDPAVDVLAPDVRSGVVDGDGRRSCTVTRHTRWQGSARGVLGRRGADGAWRWCLTTKTSRTTVACDAPHDAEVTAFGDSRIADCTAAAAAYTRTAWIGLEADLSTWPFDAGQAHGCLVETRGATVLTDTVRDLGSRPLPVG